MELYVFLFEIQIGIGIWHGSGAHKEADLKDQIPYPRNENVFRQNSSSLVPV